MRNATPIRDWLAHGLRCVTLNNPMGGINGYVFVPSGHPFHSIDYSDCPRGCRDEWCEHRPEAVVDVHGGITFSQLDEDGDWVFGFDTLHAGDFMITQLAVHDGRIWDAAAVAEETERMASQLAGLTGGGQ